MILTDDDPDVYVVSFLFEKYRFHTLFLQQYIGDGIFNVICTEKDEVDAELVKLKAFTEMLKSLDFCEITFHLYNEHSVVSTEELSNG